MVMDILLMGALLAAQTTGVAVLLHRWGYGFTFPGDVRHAGGRRCSNRRDYALCDRSAVRHTLWRSRDDVPCSSRGHPEEGHDRSVCVCGDPEPTDPGDDPHPVEDGR